MRRTIAPWLALTSLSLVFGVLASTAGCAGGGSTETETYDDDGGSDGTAGNGDSGREHDDASVDGSAGSDGAVDGGDSGGADGEADTDAGDASPDGGDGAADDSGDGLDGGDDSGDVEPPKGALELCVLNAGGPLDPCETPEQLEFGTVTAGTQRMRLFRLDNETHEDVTFETVHIDSPDFSVATVRYVFDPDDPASPPAREVVALPVLRTNGTALHFEVTFTSTGKAAGPVPADAVFVTATTASDEIFDIEVPIVGEEEACAEGFAACDGDPNNGCDTDIQASLDHCGTCGTKCAFTNASAACDEGVCTLTACTGDFVDCNKDASDGCEVNLKSDSLHCGACDAACDLANANSTCSGGSCVIVACEGSFSSCDNDVKTGCETDTSRDMAHCGGCNKKCDYANASESCEAGSCIFGGCNAGYSDCNADLADGCETHTSSDLAHCGGCGKKCDYANASESCDTGSCSFGECNSGFGNCDGNLANGCETNLLVNDLHCGTCNNPCVFPNGIGACTNGGCQLVGCAPGYKDCDGKASNGCEVHIASDLANCGDCNQKCDYANASETCESGVCTFGSCAVGFDSCDGNVATGCEANLNSDVNNCTVCDNQCQFANAQALCQSGCKLGACTTGYSNCNGVEADGCEAHLATSAQHCGACGNDCTKKWANANGTCGANTCEFAGCKTGFWDIDKSLANGCEYACNKTSDVDEPDDGFTDSNCDGIDGDVNAAIFVAKTGSDANPGTMDRPMATINGALAKAYNTGKKQVYVSEGEYIGRVQLMSGISIYGGYSAANGWKRSASYVVTIRSNLAANGRMSAVEGSGITAATILDRLSIRTDNIAVAGMSNYGFYCVTCTGVWLKNSTVEAGDAGSGTAGNGGDPGASGYPGTVGSPGNNDNNINAPGGSGGSSTCSPGGRGGNGGYGATSGSSGSAGGPGTSGGAGGPGGAGRQDPGGDGQPGQKSTVVAAVGTNGAAGNGGSTATDLWVGSSGGSGGKGDDGRGGGGGGGGGGQWCPNDWPWNGYCIHGTGGGGGGGGGGGCGGTGGTGGTAGGGSFGIFLVRSNGFQLTNNTIQSGKGGNGGAGGSAGSGGTAAAGQNGGRDQNNSCSEVGCGGRGGDGTPGARGGYGGGGAGGPSYGVYRISSSSVSTAGNFFPSPYPGKGGTGGASSGNKGVDGAANTVF